MMGFIAIVPANMAWLLTRVQFSVTLTFLFAVAAAFLLRRSAAALRHRVWAMSVLAALVLPTLIALLPEKRAVAIGLRPAPNAGDAARPMEPAAPATITHHDDYSFADEGPRAVPAAAHARRSMPAAATPPSVEAARAFAVRGANEHPAAPLAPFPGSTRMTDIPTRALTGVWAAATLLLIARQGYGIVRRNQLLRCASDIQSSPAGAALAALCRRHGVAGLPRLLVTPRATSPLCVGSVMPCIVLPADWPAWPAGQLQAVLTHELAHVVRRDVLWQQLARLACAIHWPNPLAWMAAWRMRVERELACDDFVLREGEPATRYVRWLIAFAETLGRRGARPEAVGVAMAAGNRFEQRVRAILDARRPRNGVSMRASVTMALAAGVLLCFAGIISPFGRLSERRAAAGGLPVAGPTTLPSADAGLRLAGTAIDAGGRPVDDATVAFNWAGESRSAQTDKDGKFALGVDARHLRYFSVVARTADGKLQAYERGPEGQPPANLVLRLAPARELPVNVEDKNGVPAPGVWVAADAMFDLMGEATTDAAGNAVLRVPAAAPLTYVVADKGADGIDYVLFWGKGDVQSNPYRLAFNHAGLVNLVLHETATVTVRAVDAENHPLKGVTVDPWYFELPKKGGDMNIGGSHFRRTTDERGAARVYIPTDNEHPVTLWTRLQGYVTPDRCNFDPKSANRDLVSTLVPLVHVAGHVVGKDGNAAANVKVETYGVGYGFDDFRETTMTSDGGNFAFDVAPNKYYIFAASAETGTSSGRYAIVHTAPPAQPIVLSLQQTTRVFGTAVRGPDGEAIRGGDIVVAQDDDGYYKLPPEQQFPGGTVGRRWIGPTVQTVTKSDAQGRFEFRIGSGKYILFWSAPSDARNYEAGRFTVMDEPEMEVEFHLLHEPKPAGPELVTGRVVRRDTPGAGVSEARLSEYSFGGNDRPVGTTNADGSFAIKRGNGETYIGAASPDGKLRGIVHVGVKDATATIPIGPSASADRRLVDPDGKPLPGRTITYGFKVVDASGVAWNLRFGGSVKTNDKGMFHLDGLVPGYPYTLDVVVAENIDGNPNEFTRAGTVQADKAETVRAGDLTLPAEPHERTAGDYAKEAFAAKGTIGDRYDAARRRARLTTTNLLVLVGRPELPNCRRFYEFSYTMDRPAVREQLLGYTKLAVDVRSTADARRLIDGLGIHWPAEGELALAVVDPDGKLLAQAGEKELCAADGVLDGERLTAFTKAHVPDLPDARELLAGALAKAKREDKRVILDESAPWCTWCVKLAEYVQANQAAFDRDFVFLTIDRRFKNGDAVLDQFRKEPGSIPWMVIVDADGRPLITSDAPGAGNVGYPDDQASLDHWEKMLRTGAKRLSSAEIHALAGKAAEK